VDSKDELKSWVDPMNRPREQLQPPTDHVLSENELRAVAYFAVGVSSEGGFHGHNNAYKLSFAGWVHREGETVRGAVREAGTFHDGQMEPVANSGYSIGTIQTDLGQRRDRAGHDPRDLSQEVLNAYRDWANTQSRTRPELAMSDAEYAEANRALRRQGNEIRGDRTTTTDNGYDLRAGTKNHLTEFLASNDGITFVHRQDVTQVNHLLRNGGALETLRDARIFQNASQDDQVRMATVLMKLENQSGERSSGRVAADVERGNITTLEGVKAAVPQGLRQDRDNALAGADVLIGLRNAAAQNPLRQAWQDVVANPLVNPTQLQQDRAHPNLTAEYTTIKNLFLEPGTSPAFIRALDQGSTYTRVTADRAQPGHFTEAGFIASGNNFVQWNRDGHGYANIGGQWSEIERSQITRVDRGNGVFDLNVTRNGAISPLIHVDPHAPALRPAHGQEHHQEHAPQPHPAAPGMRGPGGRPGAPERDGPEQPQDRHGPPQRHGVLMLDNPLHENYTMFAALHKVVNERGNAIDPDRRPDETVAKQVAGGLVEEARRRGLDTIGAAKFTPDGTKVGMTDTSDLSAPWAKTAAGDVGQLAEQKLSQSSENVATINQQQALEQSLKPPSQTQSMQGPDDPAPKGPRMV
jgi:hypothetical protein